MTCRLGLSDARFQWDNIAKRDATRQPASQPEADRYTKPDGRQRLFAKILALLGDSWDGRDIARCGHVRCRDVPPRRIVMATGAEGGAYHDLEHVLAE